MYYTGMQAPPQEEASWGVWQIEKHGKAVIPCYNEIVLKNFRVARNHV